MAFLQISDLLTRRSVASAALPADLQQEPFYGLTSAFKSAACCET